MTYKVMDNFSGRVIKSYSSRRQASKCADKLDNTYGAVRYSVEIDWESLNTKDIKRMYSLNALHKSLNSDLINRSGS
jgi:hypothetical protein